MAAFTIKDLTFTYPLKDKPALNGINLTVESGEFITICGKSGCGKSTLLRNLKTVLTPHGSIKGEIYFDGRLLPEINLREQANRIGYVLQNPDNQIVTDKVWHELAFGLESLGYDTSAIRLRVAEMASFFGIQSWFMRNVSELSGGQKQLLNLASIMAMQPDVLILDEPTSQLDPIAASDFLETVKKINQEIGTTIILTEHRLEDVFPMSDRAVVLETGSVLLDDTPQKVGEELTMRRHDMFLAMPSPMQIYAGLVREEQESSIPGCLEKKVSETKCPITVRDGRKWLTSIFEHQKMEINQQKERELIPDRGASRKFEGDWLGNEKRTLFKMGGKNKKSSDMPMIELKEVWFRYDRNEPDVIKDLSFKVASGQFYCIVGGNGTGKTTALSLIGGIYKPYRGKVLIRGKDVLKYSGKELFHGLLGVLPQNPQSIFVEKTVELDLLEILDETPLTKEEKSDKVNNIAELLEITDLLKMHPYDLSGGEQQRAALGKVLLLEPEILLLDEPTKGIDNYFKKKLAGILKKLQEKGMGIVMVSHDIEFCAKYGDQCAMFFDGNIVTANTPNEFFSGNSFYTTAANRMSRHIFPRAVTTKDVIDLCIQNL